LFPEAFEDVVFLVEVLVFDEPPELFEAAVFELEAELLRADVEPVFEAAVFEPFADADPFGSMDAATSFRKVLAPVLRP
jgi:hypothetical protein